MCVIISMPDGPIRTMGELRAQFVGAVLPEDWTDTAGTYEDRWCLCGVDYEAVLDRAGAEWHTDDLGEPVVTRL